MTEPVKPIEQPLASAFLDFQRRLRFDSKFRSRFLADAKAALLDCGIDMDVKELGRPILLGDVDAIAGFSRDLPEPSHADLAAPFPVPWPNGSDPDQDGQLFPSAAVMFLRKTR